MNRQIKYFNKIDVEVNQFLREKGADVLGVTSFFNNMLQRPVCVVEFMVVNRSTGGRKEEAADVATEVINKVQRSARLAREAASIADDVQREDQGAENFPVCVEEDCRNNPN